MKSREDIESLQIVKVTKEGRDIGFASFGDQVKKLSPSGFVAIDIEFSGLGEDPDLKHENLETRYAALRRVADSRAILSLGISIFDVDTDSPDTVAESDDDGNAKERISYKVATYDMLLTCQSEFSMSSDSGEFLASHKFDFNNMFLKGIPYVRASTEKISEKEKLEGGKKSKWQWDKLPRGLLWRIGRQGVPLIVHNGLFDLVFLYAAFQGPLPDTLQGFIVSLLDCMPAGYWDSKVLATDTKERCSFLGFLFAKGVLQNKVFIRNSEKLPSSNATDPLKESTEDGKDILCALYSFRGFCPRGPVCPFSHDPFAVLEQDAKGEAPVDSKDAYKRHKIQSRDIKRRAQKRKSELKGLSKKQKRKLAEDDTCNEDKNTLTNETQNGENKTSTHEDLVHSAGWDAFCTGFVFAAYRARMKIEELDKLRNQIALPYKLSTLHLTRSEYAELDAVMTDRDKPKPNESA